MHQIYDPIHTKSHRINHSDSRVADTNLNRKLAYFPGKRRQLVAAEIQEVKALKAADGVRYVSDSVVVALEPLQEDELRHFLRQLAEAILREI